MTTRLEELIKNIGGSALMYINGSLVDKKQPQISFESFFDITNEDELSEFIDDMIEKACGDGITPGTDMSGRRPHLEYICSVYKFARIKLSSEPSELEWDELKDELHNFLDNCDYLMEHDKDIIFQEVEYNLSSLKHQTTVERFNIFGSKTGNLGSCLNDYIFKFLDNPHEVPFFSQISKKIENHIYILVGKDVKKHLELQQQLLAQKPQIETLTIANLSLAEQVKVLEDKSSQQDLIIKFLEKQFSEIKTQVESLTKNQVSNSSTIISLTQFGFLASPKREINLTKDAEPNNSPEPL